MAFPSLLTWLQESTSSASRSSHFTRPTPSTLKTLPMAPNFSHPAFKFKLLEAEARSCHLVSPSRGNIQATVLLTTTLTHALFYYSAYTDSTPGIKWNVSDAPKFPSRKRWTNSSISISDLQSHHRPEDLSHPRFFGCRFVDVTGQSSYTVWNDARFIPIHKYRK